MSGNKVLTSGIPGRSRKHVQGGALLDPVVAPPWACTLRSLLDPVVAMVAPPLARTWKSPKSDASLACDYLPPDLSILILNIDNELRRKESQPRL